jgi:hypothetical protein
MAMVLTFIHCLGEWLLVGRSIFWRAMGFATSNDDCGCHQNLTNCNSHALHS